MKTVTVKKIQKLDDIAIRQYGVPSLALMENAGRAVATEALRLLKHKKNPKACIVSGVGNNAGDGFVVARHLINAGVKTKVILAGNPKKLKNDAAINYRVLKKLKYPIRQIDRFSRAALNDIKEADVVIDAIFGAGLNREIKDLFRTLIEHINKYAKKVVSVDIPSGLNGTTGRIYGVCVKAHTTVTFSFAKKGFFIREGPDHVGKVVVADIGIPKKLMKKI